MMVYHFMFPGLEGYSDQYFASLASSPVADLDEEIQTLETSDLDILPMCEFNLNDLKRFWYKPWKVQEVIHRCRQVAKWLVVIEIEYCVNHDHVIMVCDTHRYHFDHVRVRNFDCNRIGPTPNYTVTRIERI